MTEKDNTHLPSHGGWKARQ